MKKYVMGILLLFGISIFAADVGEFQWKDDNTAITGSEVEKYLINKANGNVDLLSNCITMPSKDGLLEFFNKHGYGFNKCGEIPLLYRILCVVHLFSSYIGVDLSEKDMVNLFFIVLLRPPALDDQPHIIDNKRRNEYFYEILEGKGKWLLWQDPELVQQAIHTLATHEKFPMILQYADEQCRKKHGKPIEEWLEQEKHHNEIAAALCKKFVSDQCIKLRNMTMQVPSALGGMVSENTLGNSKPLECTIVNKETQNNVPDSAENSIPITIRNYEDSKPKMVTRGTQTDFEWIIDKTKEGKVKDGMPCITLQQKQENGWKLDWKWPWEWNLLDRLKNFLFSSLWNLGLGAGLGVSVVAVGYVLYQKSKKENKDTENQPYIVVVHSNSNEAELLEADYN